MHGGGNKWLGMLFGMTVRHPWVTEGVICDPRPVWKLWDEFGIQDAEMVGFWDSNNLASTGNSKVEATVYKKKGKSLIAIGNFSDRVQSIKLDLDWEKMGLEKGKASFIVPAIKDYQLATEFNVDDEIKVQPRQGWLIIVEEDTN